MELVLGCDSLRTMNEQRPPDTERSQQHNVLEYITIACLAAREGQPAPFLLPEVANSQDQVLPAA